MENSYKSLIVFNDKEIAIKHSQISCNILDHKLAWKFHMSAKMKQIMVKLRDVDYGFLDANQSYF